MEKYYRGGGSSGSEDHRRKFYRLLSPNETRSLQEIENALNRQCVELSSIATRYEEKLALSEMPQRCKECVGLSKCPDWKFLPKYFSTELCPDASHWNASCKIPDEVRMSVVDDCLNSCGRRGNSGSNPFYAIVEETQALQERIRTLLHKGFLPSTCTRHIAPYADHLLGDGKIHALIDISIDTTSLPGCLNKLDSKIVGMVIQEPHPGKRGEDYQAWLGSISDPKGER